MTDVSRAQIDKDDPGTSGRPRQSTDGEVWTPGADRDRRRKELPAGREIITVCRSGNRSSRAAKLLATDGSTVLNLSRGMRGWATAGLPVIAEGGRPGSIA